jgi:hypothetical protein
MTQRTSLVSLTAIAYASQPPTERAGVAIDVMEKRDPDSAYMLTYWDNVDAVLDGIEGMKLRASDFLPRFRSEEDEDYKFRCQSAVMTNVYRDIAESLAGKPFEQPVMLVSDENADAPPVPDPIKDFVYNVDGSGNNLTVFASQTFFNGINHAIDWIMVDYAKGPETPVTMEQARTMGLRPYWTHILGRNMLAVRSKMVGSDEVLTYAKILEPGEPDHIREIERFDSFDERGNLVTVVEWRLWQKNTKEREYVQVDSGNISIGEIPLVSFYTGRREGRQWRFDPPMRAAVELQIQMFKQESGLEYACNLTAYPMLAANGIMPPQGRDGKPETKVAVGPNRVLWSPPRPDGGPAGSWGYVEPNAESLKFLEARIESTERRLRELGRQPLTASSSNITVITAAVAAGKAKSAVKAWALMLSNTLENALLLTAKWMAVDYDPTVHVFAEFDDWMEGEDLDALDKARERRDISHETYCEELLRRGVLSSNFTIERERERLLEDVPSDGADTVD